MAEPAPAPQPVAVDTTPDPTVFIDEPQPQVDMATIIGLVGSFLLIIGAIWLEGSGGSRFFNVAAIFIVILGTAAVTAVSYTADELVMTWKAFKDSVARPMIDQTKLGSTIIDLSVIARKRGALAISAHDRQLVKIPFLKQSMQLVGDGFQAHDIEHFMHQEIETALERQRKAAAVLRRASEVAPGMGLIGTLIGLVQMLSQLDNPSTIGPAMAIALITTFYGAMMGTMVLAPLASKVERNATEDAQTKVLILAGAASIARQENPRRLEIVLNTILPASKRIRYYD
jgi:chemotaxis protein MotA